MVQHPDIPAAVFANLWETIKKQKLWDGTVKNRCNNGDYYWVEANVTPIIENRNMKGYISVHTKPSKHRIDEATARYADWLNPIRTNNMKPPPSNR